MQCSFQNKSYLQLTIVLQNGLSTHIYTCRCWALVRHYLKSVAKSCPSSSLYTKGKKVGAHRHHSSVSSTGKLEESLRKRERRVVLKWYVDILKN